MARYDGEWRWTGPSGGAIRQSPRSERQGLEFTRQGGADVIIEARKGHDEVVRQVHAATNGAGAPCTPNLSDAPSAMETACAITAMHGIAQVPISPSPNILNSDFPLNQPTPA